MTTLPAVLQVSHTLSPFRWTATAEGLTISFSVSDMSFNEVASNSAR